MKHWKADVEPAELTPRKERGRRLRARVSALGGELERWAKVDSLETPRPPKRQGDFSGAVAGLVLVATACIGLCLVLYQVSGGPRDTFAEAEGSAD